METVYKVVHYVPVDGTGYKDAQYNPQKKYIFTSCYALSEKWKTTYELGKQLAPVNGYFFCFSDLRQAEKYAEREASLWSAVLECEAGYSIPGYSMLPEGVLLDESKWRNFWTNLPSFNAQEKKDKLSLLLVGLPDYTVLCKDITPVKVAYVKGKPYGNRL